MGKSFKMSGKGGSVEHDGGIMSFQISYLYDFESLLEVFTDSRNSNSYWIIWRTRIIKYSLSE